MAGAGHAREGEVSRRHLFKVGTFGGAGVLALAAGCGKEGKAARQGGKPASQAGSSSTGPPKRGGTLTDARYQVLTGRTMDPDTETPTSNKLRRLWYQGLLGYNLRTYAVEPEVAQKWEQPSKTDYILHLQPGVKWQNKPPADGRPLVASDVVFSLQRARTPDPQFVSGIFLDTVDQIEAPDTSTLRVTTKRPDAVLLKKLSSDGLLLLAPEVVSKAGKFATPEAVVGTGPFILRSFEDGVGATCVRNPDYWKPGLPYLDGFAYRYFGDIAAAYAALLAKQVDVVQVRGDNIKDYIARLGHTPELYKEDITGTNWLLPNTQAKPLNDARVTRALRLLADFTELRDAHGKAWNANAIYGSVFPTALDQWDLSEEEYAKLVFWQQPRDAAVKEALSLLNAAGFSKDKPLTFEASVQVNSGDASTPALAQLLQAQWRRSGQGAVDAQLKILDGPQATNAKAQRSFTYGLLPNAGAFTDPDAWLTALFRSKSSRNYAGFSDPDIDAKIDQQSQIFDEAQRLAAVKEIVRLLSDRSPQVLPYRIFSLNGLNDRVRDYTPDGSAPQSRQFEHVWLDT